MNFLKQPYKGTPYGAAHASKSNQGEEPSNSFPISFKPKSGSEFNFYIFGAIESPMQFIGAIEILGSMSEEDVMVIHLQTPGGSVGASDALIQAIEATMGHVHMNATGDVCSAGTAIMLHGDSFSISQHARFMIHNGSAGSGGKMSEYKAWAQADFAYMEDFARKTYKDFLTDEELQDMIDGKDFWMTPEEFVERSERRNTIRDSNMAAQQQAILAQAQQMMEVQQAQDEEPPKPKAKRGRPRKNPEAEKPVEEKPQAWPFPRGQ